MAGIKLLGNHAEVIKEIGNNKFFIFGNTLFSEVFYLNCKKNNIENQIADMEKRPSFDGATITVQAGESKTISDDYGVFSKYESVNRTQDGITFTHNKGENTLTISVDEKDENRLVELRYYNVAIKKPPIQFRKGQ